MLSGYKNYIFGAVIMALGVVDYFMPELQISVLGATEPNTMVSAGVAWILGRDALKSLEG